MIALACDHGALDLKEAVKKHLEAKGLACKDFGTYTADSCDYPDFGAAAARAVASGECEKGIVMCTTGIGISIAANKIKGIRCALCHDHLTAQLCRQHNDANMVAFGARLIGIEVALDIVRTFLATDFEGGRHENRIAKISALEA